MKLVNYTRDAIIDAAIHGAFDAREKSLAKREDALARKAYKAIFPPAVIKAASAVPENWFRMDTCLEVNAGGYRLSLRLSDGDKLRTPHSSYCQLLGSVAGELADEIQDFANEQEAAKEEKSAARQKLRSLIYSVTTMKQLRELWPEGTSYWEPYDRGDSDNLPAIRFDDVNAMLGIKKAA